MNGMWGYKVEDTDYKDSRTLVRYLVKTAGMGANLLLNIGPQPNGELPAVSLERLKDMGKWLRANGETIYTERKALRSDLRSGDCHHERVTALSSCNVA